MVGLIISITVMVNEHVAVFPDASVTLNVLVVVPTAKFEPDANPEV